MSLCCLSFHVAGLKKVKFIKRMMISLIRSFAVFGICFLLVFTAAFNVCAASGEVFVSSPGAWVKSKVFEIPEKIPIDEVPGGEYFLLLDEQVKTDVSSEYYYHYVTKMVNEKGVESASQISVVFDPAYEKLTFHCINVHRDGLVFDQLKEDRMQVIQRETSLEYLMYDGRLTATIILHDVRVGDIIEYSFTVAGDNPVYQGHVLHVNRVQWSTPLHEQFFRLLWPKTKPLYIKKFFTTIEPEKHPRDTHTEYIISQRDLPALLTESDAPQWYNPYPRIYFSSTSSWKEAVKWALSYYRLPETTSDDIEAIATEIRQKYKDTRERVSAALQYVQSNIRYLGVEIGVGGLIPRSPEETLKKRFGDCKDKSMLLLVILRALDVEARPVLVNTRYRHVLEELPPSPAFFNHVIVMAKVDGKTYWIDPTMSHQRGALDTLYQPCYGMALVVSDDTVSLTPMNQRLDLSTVIVEDRFDLNAGDILLLQPSGGGRRKIFAGI